MDDLPDFKPVKLKTAVFLELEVIEAMIEAGNTYCEVQFSPEALRLVKRGRSALRRALKRARKN